VLLDYADDAKSCHDARNDEESRSCNEQFRGNKF